MLVSINGSEGSALCQIGALREGFAALGHQHTFEQTHPDNSFVFVGNAPYDDYVELARSCNKATIFNVLDCPYWLPEWPQLADKWRAQLAAADRVTCISATVQADLARLLGVRADVIYYPMKRVHHTGLRKYPQFKVAMIGRLCDPGKRAGIAVKALIRAGFNESEVAVVGPEYFGYGTKMGIVSDEALNDIYNSVDYVIMASRYEGIGLPAIEAAICGAIPIVMPDLTTFNEFWVESPLGLNYQTLHSPDAVAKLIRALEDNPEWKATVKQDMLGYAELAFRPKFDAKAVASRLVEVYQSI